jgi:3-oxoacyl-[acyl-carrier-protein] synthase III
VARHGRSIAEYIDEIDVDGNFIDSRRDRSAATAFRMNVDLAGTMNVNRQNSRHASASPSNGSLLGFRGVQAILPPHTRDLEDLRRSGLLLSDISVLKELGFEKVHVCDPAHDVAWLALESVRGAMDQAEVEPTEIDVLVWASALSETHVQGSDLAQRTPIEELLSGFNYRASWLQEELHLENARVTGVAQQGCAGMFSALSTAHALLVSDPSLRNILCVGVDALPEGVLEKFSTISSVIQPAR